MYQFLFVFNLFLLKYLKHFVNLKNSFTDESFPLEEILNLKINLLNLFVFTTLDVQDLNPDFINGLTCGARPPSKRFRKSIATGCLAGPSRLQQTFQDVKFAKKSCIFATILKASI